MHKHMQYAFAFCMPKYLSYPRSTRCFSPDKMPGVSIMVTHLSTGLRKVDP